MDTATRELLNGIMVYAEIMNNTNIKFHELIEHNTDKQLHENEQLFYEIISEIMRLLPFKRISKELDCKSGILLFGTKIPFLIQDYQRIIDNPVYKQILEDISIVRNKFIHEPHNIHAAFYVGGKTSCSMGLYYKTKLCSISTIKLTNIIFELNMMFEKLQKFFMEQADACGEEYKEYPCYKVMDSYDFKKYNIEYPRVPEWMLNEPEEDFDFVL